MKCFNGAVLFLDYGRAPQGARGLKCKYGA